MRIERAAAVQMRDVLVTEEFDRRQDRARGAVTQGAERLSEDGVGDVQQLLDVVFGAEAGFQPFVDLAEPVGALAAGRALAARLVRVELRPPPHRAYHARGLVEDL